MSKSSMVHAVNVRTIALYARTICVEGSAILVPFRTYATDCTK